jgi:ParB family chromosome partitioning protein
MGTDMEQNKDESEHQVIENNKTTEDVIQNVPVTLIDPNPFQPRIDFNENDLQDLSNSIRKHGIIQPIIIRQKGDRYELIAGERRLRAGKKAGLQEVPVIIRQLTDREAAEMALIENLQRKDLNCLEEAEGYQRLLSEFGLTQKELATRIGKSQSAIANKLRLLKLPEAVKISISREIITERHARALLALPNEYEQLEVLNKVCEKGLTVKETEELIKKRLRKLDPWADVEEQRGQRVVKILKDVRIFLNTMRNVVEELRETGTDVIMDERHQDRFIDIKIRIVKN